MATTLPVPPYREPLTDDQGLLTLAWTNFMRMLFVRVGSQVALNNQELAVVQTADVTALTATVVALQAQVTALSATVVSNYRSLNQGPVL